jgi:hypothetical protein
VKIVENGNYVVKKWSELRIGQIVKIEEDEPFPADLLILATSDVKGEFLLLNDVYSSKRSMLYRNKESGWRNKSKAEIRNNKYPKNVPEPKGHQTTGSFITKTVLLL